MNHIRYKKWNDLAAVEQNSHLDAAKKYVKKNFKGEQE